MSNPNLTIQAPPSRRRVGSNLHKVTAGVKPVSATETKSLRYSGGEWSGDNPQPGNSTQEPSYHSPTITVSTSLNGIAQQQQQQNLVSSPRAHCSTSPNSPSISPQGPGSPTYDAVLFSSTSGQNPPHPTRA